jgi:hypothetical protein
VGKSPCVMMSCEPVTVTLLLSLPFGARTSETKSGLSKFGIVCEGSVPLVLPIRRDVTSRHSCPYDQMTTARIVSCLACTTLHRLHRNCLAHYSLATADRAGKHLPIAGCGCASSACHAVHTSGVLAAQSSVATPSHTTQQFGFGTACHREPLQD